MPSTDPRAFFGERAEAYRTSATHRNQQDLARMLDLIAHHGAPLTGAPALDVATGGGHTAVALAQAGARVVASDVTPAMLAATARSAADTGVALTGRVGADALALPFRAGAFRVVACRIAPHHFRDLAAFAEECARVLAPQGALYVFDLTTPEDAPEARETINRIERLRDPSHVDSYPPDAWRAALADAGLTVAHMETSTSEFDVEPWLARAGMPPERERETRALLAEPPTDLHGYGLTPEGRMRVLRVELVALRA